MKHEITFATRVENIRSFFQIICMREKNSR